MKNNSASADVKPDAENTDDIEQRESVLADEGGISESEVNKYEKEHNVDVIDDEGERNENHNIHIVTDNKKIINNLYIIPCVKAALRGPYREFFAFNILGFSAESI